MMRAFLRAAPILAMAVTVGCSSESTDPGTGGHAPVSYPEGPYGFGQGEVLPPMTLRTPDGEPVAVESFVGGAAPAALLYVTATWCFTCGPEITFLNDYERRVDGDLNAMTVLLQNKAFEDATAADVEAFDEGYGSEFATLLDPDGALDIFRDEAFIPLNVLVDTTTMRITYRETGFDQALLEQAIDAIVDDTEN